MNNFLKYGLGIGGLLVGLGLAHQAYCRIVPPNDYAVAMKAFEYMEKGRGGYESFEEFVNEGIRVKSGAHNKLTGVREFDVYFSIRDPKRVDSIGKIELVKFRMSSCGRILDTKKMTMGDGPVLGGDLLDPLN